MLDCTPRPVAVSWPSVHLEGHLIIRGHDDGSFDVRFVAAPPDPPSAMRMLRLADGTALEEVLTELDLPRDRVVEVVSSPYALHSIRARVDRAAARRLGLVASPLARSVALLTGLFSRRPPRSP
jgi:hypothetical protein